MTLVSRRLLLAGLSLGALCAPSRAADDYPTRPIRIVVPYAPGGSTDTIARIVGERIAKTLGQPVVIENKPGAASAIGSAAVARAAPDGYTLLLGTGTLAINKSRRKDLGYDVETDLAPVANAAGGPFLLLVHPDLKIRTVAELISYAKANPDKLSMASSGNGSTIHMSGELFKMMTGIKMTHVPYRGSAPALTDMIAGQVQVMFDNIPTSMEFVKSGKLRGLAVTSAARSPVLPDLPIVADFIPGFEATSWYGLGAPKGTPQEIVDKLNKEVAAMLANEKVRSRFLELGATTLSGSPADFAKLVADETEKWGKVVKFAGAKVT
jgi:tripartite-type tricarboxylate transporter receptor subunit TctC